MSMHAVNSFLTNAFDPYISSVINLSHFDGSNGGTTLTNSVGAGGAFFPSATNAALSTTQVKFGTTSLKIPDTAARAITANQANYAIGTGDFTIEFWFWPDDITGVKEINDWRPTNTSGVYVDIYTNGSDLRLYVNSADRISGANGSLTAATWNFIALSRVSGSTRLYCGTSGTAAQLGSTYTDANNYLQTEVRLGLSSFNTDPCSVCYYDDFRFTKGVGRYAGATCPIPTAAFPNS